MAPSGTPDGCLSLVEEPMEYRQTLSDWSFGLRWLVACALGLFFGGMLAFASVWTLGEIVERAAGETAAYLTVGALFGSIIGLGASIGPGLILQNRGIPASRWIVASVVAGAIGMATGFAFVFTYLDPETMPQALTAAVIGLSLGLPLGLGQWLALRRYSLLAGEWVLVSSLAFVVGLLVGLPLGGEGREWLSLGIIGLLVGAITGLGMVWSLRRQTLSPRAGTAS